MSRIFWFRKDLRLQDNQALAHAANLANEDEDKTLYPVFFLPKGYLDQTPLLQHSVFASVQALGLDLQNRLSIFDKDPRRVMASIAMALGVTSVVATESFDKKGIAEQVLVFEALAKIGIELELVGSNYAVVPGSVRKDDGTNVRVYSPFYKRWLMELDVRPFKLDVESVLWAKTPESFDFAAPESQSPFEVKAGEAFAKRTFARFQKRALTDYSQQHNRMDLSGTSQLSHALARGEIHPRTLLAQLGHSEGEEVFRKEIAWREFYADVLFHNRDTETEYYESRFEKMRYSDPIKDATLLEAWRQGKTGYPAVDAAMRQLVTTGWMHNRARMMTASFLVKDLHFEWQVGADWFEKHLTDFDPASNAHGWQWTAGCGTDASPYYRVFNPILQGQKFDPNGDYVRKYVSELRHISGGQVHEPWLLIDGLTQGYPAPIIDHATERNESLARLEEIKIKN
jgi:deoxyribodipyrimidine photo-lyase